MFNVKKLALSFLLSIAGVLLAFSFCSADTVKTPVITGVMSGDDGSFAKPVIIGTTEPGTDVLVYMDGVYTGTADIMMENAFENEFIYEHADRLWPGEHSFILIARDKETLILSPPTKDYEFTVKEKLEPAPAPGPYAVPAPMLIEPNESTVTAKVKPPITGLAANNTFVHIYIDGIYNGKTGVMHDSSGTDDFAYIPFLNLSRGKHTVYAVAEDAAGRKSARSNTLHFNIELPMPAPTMVGTVVNSRSSEERPFITGLAKNDSMIKVFVDKKFDGQFQVNNHESGTANFAYRPSKSLTTGNHLVYTTATDKRGKESIWSNMLKFEVEQQVQPQVSSISEEKTIDQKEEEVTEEPEVSTPQKEEVQPTEKNEIEKILEDIKKDQPEEEEEATSSLLQGSTKLNIAIFVIFLVGVIAWIFWVNRELVRERKAQGPKQNKSGDDNSGKPPTITI